MQFRKERWARVAGRRVLLVRPCAGSCRVRTRGLPATLLVVWVFWGAAAAAWAGPAGGLTFEGCVATSSAAVGCVNLPAGTDTDPLGVAVSPDGRSVYVAAGDRVEHFFAASNGDLTYDGCVSSDGSGGACADIPGTSTPLTGATAVAVSPDGRSVYVASSGGLRTVDSTVSHFFAAAQGQLTWDGCVSDTGLGGACAVLPSAALLGLKGIAVSSSGAVYAVSSEGVSHFFAAPQGQLTWDGCVGFMTAGCTAIPSVAFAGPDGIAVSANGKSVYVTSEGAKGGAVSHFFVAPQGQLSWDGCVSDDGTGGSCADVLGTATPLAHSDAVAVSADGRSVDVTSSDGIVSHFFAAPNGQLSWDGCVSDDGSGGSCADVPGGGNPLMRADSVALSADGRSAYVGASGSTAVSVFGVAAQGQLTYQACVGDAGSGCSGTPGPAIGAIFSIALSSDGLSLYTASPFHGIVAHFTTSATTTTTTSQATTTTTSQATTTTSVIRLDSQLVGAKVVKTKGGGRLLDVELLNNVKTTVTVTLVGKDAKPFASHRFLGEPRGDHVLGVAIGSTAKAGLAHATIIVAGPGGTTRTFKAKVTIPKS